MKARLLCDGGYYQQSLTTIDSYTPTSKKDSIELTYRKARIYQGMDKHHEAITLYKQIIKTSPNSGYYFAPNSCLQLGYIYRKLNNKEAAKQYFLEALSYDDYEYKNSIETKAKAGLNELGKTP
jgi:tetratricopeptide (TPR) repeat protein